jgi:hypothetical protein
MLARELREAGMSSAQAGRVFRDRYKVSMLVGIRQAWGWSQPDAADAWNSIWPDQPKTAKSFSYWEVWPSKNGLEPSLLVLRRLAQLYRCGVADLVSDLGDFTPTEGMPMPEENGTAAQALHRAEQLQAQVTERWPDLWWELDYLRREPPGSWPAWCLLPSTVAALVVGDARSDKPPGDGPGSGPAVAVTALYAWRYARSVFVYDEALASRVMAHGPADLTETTPISVLPQWCMYVAGGHPQWPGTGVWAFLDYDYPRTRPVLRLLVDLADGGLDALVPIGLPLDRTITEAVTTDLSGLSLLDAQTGRIADVVDRLVALVTYPARPGVCRALDGRAGDPVRSTRPVEQPTVWAVG